MRRSVIALLTALALVALVPTAALAAPREASIKSITATVVSSGAACDVEITVSYGPRKSVGTWDITVWQYMDGAAQSGPYDMTLGHTGRVKFTYSAVTLGSHVFKWQVTAKDSGVTVAGPVFTSTDTWTDAASCPALRTVVASWP